MSQDMKEKTTEALNTLIETCCDGAKGFEQAADALKPNEPLLAETFSSYARERKRFAEELQTQVRQMGGEPSDGGTFAGAAHRGWINLKTAISSNDHKAVVAECERGEDVALKNFRQALAEPMDAGIRTLVQTQKDSVKEAHDHIRRLEIQSS